MADTLTALQRSERMSRVKSFGNASTELRLISLLKIEEISGWRRKYKLVGKPDLVFPKQRIVIFIDGCFWHGCPRHRRTPKSRIEFWKVKLGKNIKRDRQVNKSLRVLGWKVLRVWECKITRSRADQTVAKIKNLLINREDLKQGLPSMVRI